MSLPSERLERTTDATTLKDLIEGLAQCGGSPNIKDYVYAGGDRGAALAYFHTRYPGRSVPLHCDGCLCTHVIERNFYIENKYSKRVFVIGCECIRRFLKTVERTCTFCEKAHKNRKDNMCAPCRKTHAFINVQFNEKEEAKRMGACWNPRAGMWWVHPKTREAIAHFGIKPSPPPDVVGL